MKLGDQRDLFEIPDGVSYLNCSYMSPILRETQQVGEEAVAGKSRPWEILPPDFFDAAETARGLFARLVGGEADGVAIIPAVSYGIALAAANLPVREGQSIIILEDQFPSNVYAWRELARRKQADLVTVARPADHDWTGAVLDKLDEKTAVVAVPNCHWMDGALLDLEVIGARAREAGAALVVDAIQSLGAHPFDVAAVRPDFLVASSYKWLLGPYGLGFVYVGEAYREGVPLEHNWISRHGSENFSKVAEYQDAFQPGARRFDMGERSNFILLPMVIAAMRRILAWGVDNISETLGELTDLVATEADKLGAASVPAGRRARHMIGLRLSPGAPADLAEKLAKENVYVSVRGGSVRVSPHLYNTEKDVRRLFDVMARGT